MSARAKRAAKPAPRKPPRVVFDTNVLISALVFPAGVAGSLRQAWQSGRCVPLASEATVKELMRVLAYPKFKLDPVEQEELLADYLPWVQVTRTGKPAPIVPACRDPFDLPFLRLAAAGGADALVTGDKDLLELADDTPYVIVSPDRFLATLA